MNKDLNIRPENMKLVEENIGTKLFVMGLGNDFLHMTPAYAQANKRKNK